MHLAHSLPESKVSRLQDRTAALLADGYRIGYKHGVWRGSLYGFAAAMGLAFLALVAREAAAEVTEVTVRLETYESVYEVANRCNSLAVETVGMQAHGAPGCAVGGAMGGQSVVKNGVRILLDDCLIIARKPQGADDFAALHMLGHEGWHCFTGKYHE